MENIDILDIWPSVELMNRYTVVQKMGRGGYGTVYKVIDAVTKKERAIKISKKKRSLLSEYNLMKNLHLLASVPIVYEKFEIGKGLAFVMDLCLEDLGKLAARNMSSRFVPKTCLAILFHLVVAVKALHSSRVIHADIKPANIMLSPQHQSSWPIKLSDFGNATSLLTKTTGINELYLRCPYATFHLQDGNHPNRRDDCIMSLYAMFELADFTPFDHNNFTRLTIQKKRFERDSRTLFQEGDEEWLKTLSYDFVNCNPPNEEPNYAALFRGIRSAIDGFKPEEYKLPVSLDPITQLITLT